jgi:hypothetical protein
MIPGGYWPKREHPATILQPNVTKLGGIGNFEQGLIGRSARESPDKQALLGIRTNRGGRQVPLSKTGGRRFEPCHSCHFEKILFVFSYLQRCDTPVRQWFVLGAFDQQAHRFASHTLLASGLGVDFGLADRRPVENGHQLGCRRTVLCSYGRTGLAEPMGCAFW